MAQVTVSITGIARGVAGAVFVWNGQIEALVDLGGGNLQTAFQSSPGTFLYSIDVSGQPGDPWTATVSDGVTTHSPAGQMNVHGFSTTGNIAFTVVN